MPTNTWRVGVRRMGLSSFQWCPVTGQGAMGTNGNTGSSIWTWGVTSSLWGWWRTGTGCPVRLWSLLLWRYSRPDWTRSCAACCRCPCFGRGFGLDDPQRSLPTPTILWFCDSVILWSQKQNTWTEKQRQTFTLGMNGQVLGIQTVRAGLHVIFCCFVSCVVSC